MPSARLALATVVLGLAAAVSALPPLPANTTGCGLAPTDALPCGPQCPVVDAGVCTDSCGTVCKSDSECGAYPWSACWVCVDGVCDGDATFGDCPQVNARTPGSPIAPVLPTAWNATFSMTNYTDPSAPAVEGKAWYDYSVGGLRQDFYGPCPLIGLIEPPGNNSLPCSSVFYKDYQYIVFDADLEAKAAGKARRPAAAAAAAAAAASTTTCCQYHFPVWAPDSYVVANASFGGNSTVDDQNADLWRFEYTCAWIKPQPEGPWPARLPAYTVQRDLYTVAGTNIPLAMNETLTSGMSIFRGTQVGPQDTGSVFGDFLDGYNCLDTSDPNYYAVCNRYTGTGRLSYLGYN